MQQVVFAPERLFEGHDKHFAVPSNRRQTQLLLSFETTKWQEVEGRAQKVIGWRQRFMYFGKKGIKLSLTYVNTSQHFEQRSSRECLQGTHFQQLHQLLVASGREKDRQGYVKKNEILMYSTTNQPEGVSRFVTWILHGNRLCFKEIYHWNAVTPGTSVSSLPVTESRSFEIVKAPNWPWPTYLTGRFVATTIIIQITFEATGYGSLWSKDVSLCA